MASIIKSVETVAPVRLVWSAIRDIGALHTRLVPGFVTDTVLDDDARIVTFANGMVMREPIITIDDEHRRLVWSVEGGPPDHYNGAAQAIEQPDGTTVVMWTADFKPDELADTIDAMMTAGAAAMKVALDRTAAEDDSCGPRLGRGGRETVRIDDNR
jgi:Polyketide cyclase / dehydrase and lipid transport